MKKYLVSPLAGARYRLYRPPCLQPNCSFTNPSTTCPTSPIRSPERRTERTAASDSQARWEDMTAGSNVGEGFIFDSAGNTNGTNGGLPDWDGVIDNLPQIGNYVGLSPFANDSTEDRNNARRALVQSAGEMAGAGRVLWASMAIHFPDRRFQFAPGLMLTDGGGFSDRVLDITDDSTGLGIGHGSAWGQKLNAITYNAGVFDTRTEISDMTGATDIVLLLKFEFGDTSDTVSTWFFPEDQPITRADFDANAGSTTSSFDIDEFSLSTLAVGFTRAGNAYDEVRIGTTFDSVISLPPVGPADADVSTVSASPSAVPADGSSASVITVTITDTLGIPIGGKDVTLANTDGPGAPDISPTGPVSTDVNGEAVFTVTSDAAGIEEFTATNTTDSMVLTQTAGVTFVGAADAGLSTVAASPTTIPADGSSTSTITVTVLGLGDSPLEGKEVTLANTAGPQAAAIIPAGAASTDAAGVATFTVSSNTSGVEEFTATVTTDSVVITEIATVNFVGEADPAASTVEASPSSAVADGAAASTITVSLKDANGFPVEGHDVTLSNTGGPQAAEIDPPDPVVTDAEGEAIFFVTSATVGTEEFTAADTTDSVTINATASVEFLDPAVPYAVNVNFNAFTGGNFTPGFNEVESELSGPAGGLGTGWNQFSANSSSGTLLTPSGIGTGVAFTTDFSEGRFDGAGATPLLRSTLTDFGRGAASTLSITGLQPGALYDVWLASYRNQGSAVERTFGRWTANNPTTSDGIQFIDNRDGQNGTTFVEGYNYIVFETVEVDGSGEISFDGKGMTVADGADDDYRLGLSGFQLTPVGRALITSFGVPGAEGVIDQSTRTISLEVPFGTDLSSLAPEFALTSGSADQTSGAPPSPTFADQNPATYTVTDDSTDPDTVNEYTVTVTVAPQIGNLVIDLGGSPGTMIEGGGVIGSGPANLPLPAFGAGSILRSISVDAKLESGENSFASDLTVLFDTTAPLTGDDFSLGFISSGVPQRPSTRRKSCLGVAETRVSALH